MALSYKVTFRHIDDVLLLKNYDNSMISISKLLTFPFSVATFQSVLLMEYIYSSWYVITEPILIMKMFWSKFQFDPNSQIKVTRYLNWSLPSWNFMSPPWVDWPLWKKRFTAQHWRDSQNRKVRVSRMWHSTPVIQIWMSRWVPLVGPIMITLPEQLLLLFRRSYCPCSSSIFC